jgi:MYXO-CTERM domain-containing protein
MNQTKKILARGRAVLIACLAMIWLAFAALAAPPTAVEREAVTEMSRYLDNGAGILDVDLDALGFQRPVPGSEWATWTTEAKLYSAYLSAEEAEPGSGKRVLAELSKNLEDRYGDSARQNQVFQDLRGQRNGQPIRFASIQAGQLDNAKLDPSTRAAVQEIARYMSPSQFGTTADVLQVYFDYPPHKATEMAIRYRSADAALLAAYVDQPDKFKAGFARLQDDVRKTFDFDPFDRPAAPSSGKSRSPDDPPRARGPPPGSPYWKFVDGSKGNGPGPAGPKRGATPTTGGPTPPHGKPPEPPSGGGGGGSGGQAKPAPTHSVPPPATQTARRYAGFRSSLPKSAGFRTMSRGTRGFGGVVFGNESSISTTLGTISKLAFEPIPDSLDGHLVVTFADGRALKFGPVWASHALAARRIVYGEMAGTEPMRVDDGVGLVGIADNTPIIESCDSQARTLTRSAHAFNVIMHPALENTSLGWAALNVDTWAISLESSITSLDPNATEEDRRFIRNLFAAMHHERFLGTWKVVDAPLEFVAEHDRLVPLRKVDVAAPELPGAAIRSSFVDMHIITDGNIDEYGESQTSLFASEGVDLAFQRRFAAAVPRLVGLSWDFYEVNRFAPTLALMRLAREAGVKAPAVTTDNSSFQPTPLAIVITKADGVGTVPPFDPRTLAERSRGIVDLCLDELERQSSVVDSMLQEIGGREGSGVIMPMLWAIEHDVQDVPEVEFAIGLLGLREQLSLRMTQTPAVQELDVQAGVGVELEPTVPPQAAPLPVEPLVPPGCACNIDDHDPRGQGGGIFLSLLLALLAVRRRPGPGRAATDRIRGRAESPA